MRFFVLILLQLLTIPLVFSVSVVFVVFVVVVRGGGGGGGGGICYR